MTVKANHLGEVYGQFDVPGTANPNPSERVLVRAGARLVSFTGSASPTPTEAHSTYVGRGVLKIEELRTVNTLVTRINRVTTITTAVDPLAQTFILERTAQISAVRLKFLAKGGSPVVVQIREVSLGVPTAGVLVDAVLQPSQITADPTGATWTTFHFPATVLDAFVDYCLVVLCDDAIAEIATAGIGEYDQVNARWVTEQPYQVGVLLSSSNNRTWTPHQTKDLTFELLESVYSAPYQRTITLHDAVSVVAADYLMVMAAVLRPTSACDITFTVTTATGSWTVIEGEPIRLGSTYTGEVTVTATLTGDAATSPVLMKDVSLIVGHQGQSGTYVTRAISTYSGTQVDIYFDANLPSGAGVDVAVQTADGPTWTTIASPLASMDLEAGWKEYRYQHTGLSAQETRVKLTITGSISARPRVRKLRVAII